MMIDSWSDEEWRPFPEFEGRYEVSSLGRVKSLPNSRFKGERILKQQANAKFGHRYVGLTTVGPDGKWKQRLVSVHRAVAMSFVPNPEGKPFACHKDGDTGNNAASNLYWGTPFENMADRERHGTVNRGARNGMTKLTEIEVAEAKALLSEGKSQYDVAKAVGCARTTIAAIAQGRTWSHI